MNRSRVASLRSRWTDPGDHDERNAQYAEAPPEVVYAKHMETRRVTRCGTVRYGGYQRSLSQALAGYDVGFEFLGNHRFRVWFAGLCLGDGMLPWEAPLRPAQTEAERAA
jgi:hypothetical protein